MPTTADDVLAELKTFPAIIDKRDRKYDDRFRELEDCVNGLCKRVHRPGGEYDGDVGDERRNAVEWLETKHLLSEPVAKAEPYVSSSDEINRAIVAHKALGRLFRDGDPQHQHEEFRKSLSEFSMGGLGWVLPPEYSNRVVRCLHDPTDVASLMNQTAIGAQELILPVDNEEWEIAGWACETSCWANNPTMVDGLGELRIKPETLRDDLRHAQLARGRGFQCWPMDHGEG